MKTQLLMVLALVIVGCGEPPPKELEPEPMGTLPTWQFKDAKGRSIGSEQLAGQPYVANFLFTSCPTACPPLAKATAKLQGLLMRWRPSKGPRIVSITVDPLTDTPEALRTFGRKYGAKPWVWSFATAPYEQMEKLVVGGFYQPIVRRDRGPNAPAATVADKPTPLDTAHGVRFVLVDGQGRMRALYERDDASLARLDKALRWLSYNPGK